MIPKWLSPNEFCALYRVHKTSLRAWLQQGILQSTTFGRVVRIKDPCWPLLEDGTENPDPVERLYLFTPSQAAEMLGMTPRNLRLLAAEGKISYGQFGKRKRLYSLAEIRRMLAMKVSGRRKVGRRDEDVILLDWAKKKLKYPPGAAM